MVVYKITNTQNSKCYVGITSRGISCRFKEHIEAATMGKNFKLSKAIRKYGQDVFEIELLEECDTKEHAAQQEQHWISTLDSYSNGYNMTFGGEGISGASGWPAWNKGKPAWNRGITMKNPPWNLGQAQTETTKEKISAARKGKPWSMARRLAQENRKHYA